MQREDEKVTLPNKFNLLYQEAHHRQARKEQIYKNCRDKECTFKPQLVSKPRPQTAMLEEKEIEVKTPIHERLFERAALIKKKAKQTADSYAISKNKEEECTFKPKVNKERKLRTRPGSAERISSLSFNSTQKSIKRNTSIQRSIQLYENHKKIEQRKQKLVEYTELEAEMMKSKKHRN